MVTWPEVVDTAVKIGLGPLIGGLIAYFAAKLAHRKEIEKELVNRRRDALERIGEQALAWELKVIKLIQIFTELHSTQKAGGGIDPQLRQDAEKTAQECESLADDFVTLEARLTLLGELEGARIVRRYGDMLIKEGEPTFYGREGADADALYKKLQAERNALFKLLGDAYRRGT